MSGEKIAPLTKNEVVKAVEGNYPSRIPLVRAKWWGEGLRETHGDELNRFDKYPEDVEQFFLPNPAKPDSMNLSWEWGATGGHDSGGVIDDWSKLDEFIEKLPAPENDTGLHTMADKVAEARKNDRYILFGWWRLFFEMPWGLRGMENLLCDFYTDRENLNRLYEALCNTYCAYIDEAVRLFSPDGFWTSDDLGHQTSPMMSPEVFHEQIAPFYCRVSQSVKRGNLHFWLHSCGNNTPLMDDLIASGVDVLHPVQKFAMDEKEVAEAYGGKITFLSGIDVQHTLQEKSPEGVREEVRFLIDTFDRHEGRMCIAAGNGIVKGTPLENIEAFLDEACRYGKEHRQKSTN